MAAIDTTNWVHHDNLRGLNNADLNTFATNNTNFYCLFESEPASLTSFSDGGDTVYGRRFDFAQVPFLISNVPTQGESFQHSYSSISHGKGVRPYQTMRWTNPQGQHVHCMPTVDSVQADYQNANLKLHIRFYYSSLTSNYAFPNFNDASPELDIWLFDKDDPANYIRLVDFPISTTGAGSNIVFSTTAPSGSVLRRSGVGTGEMEVHGLTHIAPWQSLQYHGDFEWDQNTSQGEYQPLYAFGQHSNTGSRRLVVAVRWHSQVAPFSFDYNVSRQTNPTTILSQVGPYGGPQSHQVSDIAFVGDDGVLVATGTHEAVTQTSESPVFAGAGSLGGIIRKSDVAVDSVIPHFIGSAGVFTGIISGTKAAQSASPVFSGDDELNLAGTLNNLELVESGGGVLPVVLEE